MVLPMTDDDWKKVEEHENQLPGPEAFFISGYDPPQIAELLIFLDALGLAEVPVKPCTEEHLGISLEEALTGESEAPPIGEGKLPHVMVISGLTFTAVQAIMAQFAKNGLPRPIFATSTPSNLRFTVKELLLHLLKEQEMTRQQAKKQS